MVVNEILNNKNEQKKIQEVEKNGFDISKGRTGESRESHETRPVTIYKKPPELITERIFVKKTPRNKALVEKCSELCVKSKLLYNMTNKIVRTILYTNKFPNGELDEKKLPSMTYLYHKTKNTKEYRDLNAQSSQQTIKILLSNWKGYLEGYKEWKKNPDKFLDKPQPPGYKKPWEEFLVVFTNQQCKVKLGRLYFPKRARLPAIKTRINGKINQIRIVSKICKFFYVIEIIFEPEVQTIPDLDPSRVIGIDLGVQNLATIVNNFDNHSYIIKGGPIKSMNQFFNKMKSKLDSIYDKQKIKYKTQTTKVKNLDVWRYKKQQFYSHMVSKSIVDYCIAHKAGKIVIGYNPKWKQGTRIGKKNTQNFEYFPHRQIIDLLKYKANLAGITLIEVEESHTSKCSALDLEPIGHHAKYLGVRGVYNKYNKKVDRGLFKTASGIIVNSDINGALNILRLVIGDDYIKNHPNIKAIIHPKRWNIFKRSPEILHGGRDTSERVKRVIKLDDFYHF